MTDNRLSSTPSEKVSEQVSVKTQTSGEPKPYNGQDLTPQRTVEELNRYIVGQHDAKRAVAIALRNRWRRQRLTEPLRSEVVPKNILMIGPTGCGKTEIARRMAKLVDAPFLKVEATRFTEVGYVGRDVEQIIRDLVEQAVQMETARQRRDVEEAARMATENRILDACIGVNNSRETRERYRQRLQEGAIEDQEIEIEINETPSLDRSSLPFNGSQSNTVEIFDLSEQLGKMFGRSTRTKKRMTVGEARHVVLEEEINNRIERDKLSKTACQNASQNGIVFIDEIDKIAARSGVRGGDVSREGVQRDLLPLIEGVTVQTRHGAIDTDHILFIASGAFHDARPSDLMPELQGRLPIRVMLQALTEEDFLRILQEPEHNLPKQSSALLATEGLKVEFDLSALKAIAAAATKINAQLENIGARRLHTLMERIIEDISFSASDLAAQPSTAQVVITSHHVEKAIAIPMQDSDISKYII